MRSVLKVVFIFLAVVIPAAVQAAVFVDWRGGFHVDYPDDWYHVAYTSVNVFLDMQQIDSRTFDYDAVLAKKGDRAFFNEPYVFIRYLPLAGLTDREVDSIIRSIPENKEKDYIRGSLTGKEVVFTFNHPIYDQSLRAYAMAVPIKTKSLDKIYLEIRKFYKDGIASFLCYSPRETYLENKPIFLNFLNSFSTENLDKVAPKESLKVVNLADRKAPAKADESTFGESNESPSGGISRRTIYIVILIVILAGAALFFVTKKRKKSFMS